MNDEAAAAWLKAQGALQQCDEVLAVLREREAAGPVSQWQPPQPEPVRRQPEPTAPRPVPPPAPPVASKVLRTRHDSQGRVTEVEEYSGSAATAKNSWEQWIRNFVSRSLETFAEGVGDFMREDVIARLDRIEKRLTEIERATGRGMQEAADD